MEEKRDKGRVITKAILDGIKGSVAGLIGGDLLNAVYTSAGVTAPFWATAIGLAALLGALCFIVRTGEELFR